MSQNAMQIHPIRTEEDHRAALARIAELMGAKPNSREADELDVLATLVDAYESKHHPIDPPDPIAAIQFRMEQQGLTRSDLEGLIGSRGRVSEVLNGKRELTIGMIRRLRAELGIPADSLIAPAQPRTRRSRPARAKKSTSRATAPPRGKLARSKSKIPSAIKGSAVDS